ncbi:hypothetical protein ACFQE7_12040 [Nonomuraea ferruginea]|uniref:hypothetical protein n=1 Tax=Nonomuraea ferruginea TaxID=46174 RepID=UPI0036216F09
MVTPNLSFAQATPYDEYVGTDTLRALPGPRTDAPEEPAFLVTTQVMELYFGLVRTELRLAARLLGTPDLPRRPPPSPARRPTWMWSTPPGAR